MDGDEGERSGRDEPASIDEFYDGLIVDAMRYLGKTLQEAEEMTLREYSYGMHAYNLQMVDKQYELHLLAWQIKQAGAVKEKGKKTVPYFKNFNAFFNYEEQLNSVTGKAKQKTDNKMQELLRKANS